MTTPSAHSEAATKLVSGTGRVRHSVPSFDGVKFGFSGIRARFRDKPGRLLRCIDPFSCEPVEFASPIQYENWLLRRFDPSIVYLNATQDRWEALHRGRLLAVKPHLHWARSSGANHLEIVAVPGKDVSTAILDALQIVAHSHGLKPGIRTATEIRKEPVLLDFLDRTRQRLVLHMREMRDVGVRNSILATFRARLELRRGDVLSECVAAPARIEAEIVDSALFWLRQTRALQFDFEGGRYDDQTVIRPT